MPNEATDNFEDTQNIMEMMAEELAHMQTPSISAKDRDKVSDHDLIADIHALLTGNGDPTKGMVYKLVETRVDGRVQRRALTTVRAEIKAQREFCAQVQEQKVKNGLTKERDAALAEVGVYRKVGLWLLDKRWYIIIIGIAGIMYIHQSVLMKVSLETAVKAIIANQVPAGVVANAQSAASATNTVAALPAPRTGP